MEVKPRAISVFQSAVHLISKDLEALPESAFTQKFGPKTRTVADIIFEINLVNDHIGMVVRDEEPFEWPEGGWICAPEGFASKQVVIDAFMKSSGKILETIESMSEEEICGSITTERGETTRYERFQFMAMHMWYHSGQFNYIQTLFGDDDWHW